MKKTLHSILKSINVLLSFTLLGLTVVLLIIYVFNGYTLFLMGG